MTKRNLHQDRVASENESLAEEARDAQRRSDLDAQETARWRAEESRRNAEMEKAQRAEESRHKSEMEKRQAKGEPAAFTLVEYITGAVLGAFMAPGDAEWIDLGNGEMRRVARIDTPAAERVPVVYVSEANAEAMRDPKVSPPDVFSGVGGANLSGVTTILAWYHLKHSGDGGKVGKRIESEAADVA